MQNIRRINRIFALLAALSLLGTAWAVLAPRRESLASLGASAQQLVLPDGTGLDLRDDGAGTEWLRRFSREGELLAFLPFPNEELGLSRRILAAEGGRVILYEEVYSSADNRVSRAAVYLCDLSSGTRTAVWEAAYTDAHGVERLLASPLVRDGIVWLGEVRGDGTRLRVRRLVLSDRADTVAFEVALPVAVNFFHIAADGAVLVGGRDSTLRRYDGRWQALFTPLAGEAVCAVSVAADGTLYALAVRRDGAAVLYRGGPDGRLRAAPLPEGVRPLGLSFTADDTWVAVDESRGYQLSSAGERSGFSALSVPTVLLLSRAAAGWISALWMAELAVLWALRHLALRRKTALPVKQLMAAAPLFAAGLLLLRGAILAQVTEAMEAQTYERLLTVAVELRDTIDPAEWDAVDWGHPYGDPAYQRLWALVSEHQRGSRLPWRDAENGATGEVSLHTSVWLYRVARGGIYTACSGDIAANLELSYVYKEPPGALMTAILDSREPLRGRMRGSSGVGDWLVVLAPIWEGGRLVGIVEVAGPAEQVGRAVEEISGRLLTLAAGVLGAALLCYLGVLLLSLRALKALERGARAISGGALDTRVHLRTTDETAEIAAAFNAMADSVERSVQSISAIRDGYSRFVPGELLGILRRETIAQVAGDDCAELDAAFLVLRTDDFAGLRGRTLFRAMNRFYDLFLPRLDGGVVEAFGEQGLSAFFPGDPERALCAALGAFSVLDRAEPAFGACCATLLYGGALLGVVGGGGRLNMTAVSALDGEAAALCRLGLRCGCRLLLTGSTITALGAVAARYRTRLLGYFSVGGERHTVYDAYDCQSPDLVRDKAATAAAFESGVEAYFAGEYAEAYRLFLAVVKQSPGDLAAREYLRRSCLRLHSGLPPEPLLCWEES